MFCLEAISYPFRIVSVWTSNRANCAPNYISIPIIHFLHHKVLSQNAQGHWIIDTYIMRIAFN